MISIVVPIYNNIDEIKQFYKTLTKCLKDCAINYECVFVDNGSHDESILLLRDLCEKDYRLHYIALRRNICLMGALYIGAQHTKGDIIITMNIDHPDYMIEEFYHTMQTKEVPYIGGLLRKSAQSDVGQKQRLFKAFHQEDLKAFFDVEDFDGFRGFVQHNHSDMTWLSYTNLETQQRPLLIRVLLRLNIMFARAFIYTVILLFLTILILLPLVLIFHFKLETYYSLYISSLLAICMIAIIQSSYARLRCVNIRKKVEAIKESTFQ